MDSTDTPVHPRHSKLQISPLKVKELLDETSSYSGKFRKKIVDFSFSMRTFSNHESPGVVLYMFVDLGFDVRFRMRKSTLIRFILSIQKGYRDIPYHNWSHACGVAHFCYVLLKRLDLVRKGYLTDIEALSLVTSALAHDIDHRGRNNHFNLCTKSELYQKYKEDNSIMERHHIAMALQVLNSEDCNIVGSMSKEESDEFHELLQWNILATDLATYMQNRYDYFYTLSTFDKTDKMNRRHLSAIIMTAADLCDNVKKWDQNLPCVKSIFHEFFEQGDEEIALGLKPMPMMDRRVAYIPQVEIQFINSIVRPAYASLADLLPPVKECLKTLEYFEDLWLLSTSVFDEHSNLQNSLEILDLKEMKEENLKKLAAPQIHDFLKEHGIRPVSIGHIATRPLGSVDSIDKDFPIEMERDEDTGEVLKRGPRSLSIPPSQSEHQKNRCCEIAYNYLCCFAFRNRGLVAARAVRKLKFQREYLSRRSNNYGLKRSIDSGDRIALLDFSDTDEGS